MKISEEDLIATKDEFIAKNLDQKREILIIKNPPYFHACGSNNVHPIINQQTIPYKGGGLDISTGIFVSPYPRSYSVTWSLRAGDIAGENTVNIYLRKNGQNIQESNHWSHYTGPAGYVVEQGKGAHQKLKKYKYEFCQVG